MPYRPELTISILLDLLSGDFFSSSKIVRRRILLSTPERCITTPISMASWKEDAGKGFGPRRDPFWLFFPLPIFFLIGVRLLVRASEIASGPFSLEPSIGSA